MRISCNGLEVNAGPGARQQAMDLVKSVTANGEEQETKRILIRAVVVLFSVAAIVVVFSPAGKEAIAMAVVLTVLALGAIGCSRFILRFGNLEIDTRENNEANVS